MVTNNITKLIRYFEYAKIDPDYKFYHTSEEIGKMFFPQISTPPALMLIRDFDDPRVLHTDPFEISNFRLFFNKYREPTLASLSEENYNKIFLRQEKIGVLLFYKEPLSEKLRKLFYDFANAKKNAEHLFLLAGNKNPLTRKIIQKLKLSEFQFPVIEIIDIFDGNIIRYRYQEKEFDIEKLCNFYQLYIMGMLNRTDIKSDQLRPATIIQNKSEFQKTILKNLYFSYDTIVLRIPPKCNIKCHRWEIQFSTAAYDLRRNKNLKFIIFYSDNESGELEIRLFTKKNSKNVVIQYNNKWVTSYDIIEFIQKYAQNTVILPKRDYN